VIASVSSALVSAESAAGSSATILADRQAPFAQEYALAEQAFRAGDLNKAQERYSKILHTHGDQPLAWFRLGVIYQRQQDPRAALRAYESALVSADRAAASDETRRIMGKARFNRAVLLLQGASDDLGQVPPGLLDRDLDVSREVMAEHVNAALLAVGIQPSRRRAEAAQDSDAAGAKGYVYTAPEPRTTAAPDTNSVSNTQNGPKSTPAIPGIPAPAH
jgi:tetratricopeptide (TPR) repeat protein